MKLEGMPVFSVGALFEETLQRIPVEYIRDTWLLLEDGFNLNVRSLIRRMKRLMDVFVSAACCLSPGPSFSRASSPSNWNPEARPYTPKNGWGLHGREFTVYKIRSMRVDAEKKRRAMGAKIRPRASRA